MANLPQYQIMLSNIECFLCKSNIVNHNTTYKVTDDGVTKKMYKSVFFYCIPLYTFSFQSFTFLNVPCYSRRENCCSKSLLAKWNCCQWLENVAFGSTCRNACKNRMHKYIKKKNQLVRSLVQTCFFSPCCSVLFCIHTKQN